MTRKPYLVILMLCGTTALVLYSFATRTPEQPRLPPYVERMTQAMNSPGADRVVFQGLIDKYYAASPEDQSMMNSVIDAPRRLGNREAREKAIQKLDSFCSEQPTSC